MYDKCLIVYDMIVGREEVMKIDTEMEGIETEMNVRSKYPYLVPGEKC